MRGYYQDTNLRAQDTVRQAVQYKQQQNDMEYMACVTKVALMNIETGQSESMDENAKVMLKAQDGKMKKHDQQQWI